MALGLPTKFHIVIFNVANLGEHFRFQIGNNLKTWLGWLYRNEILHAPLFKQIVSHAKNATISPYLVNLSIIFMCNRTYSLWIYVCVCV